MTTPKPHRSFAARSATATSRGFTLVEVLVALLIVSLTLATSTRAIQGLAASSKAIDERQFALWSADNFLQEQRITKTPLGLGDQTLDCPQGRYAFRCVVLVLATPNPRFYRVSVKVMLDKRIVAQLFHIVDRLQL